MIESEKPDPAGGAETESATGNQPVPVEPGESPTSGRATGIPHEAADRPIVPVPNISGLASSAGDATDTKPGKATEESPLSPASDAGTGQGSTQSSTSGQDQGRASTSPTSSPAATVNNADVSPRTAGGESHKSAFREFLDTVVFVVFLVLLLKTFVAEAFVIPTGSMAPTRLGNHFVNTCPQCGWEYFVGAGGDATRRPAMVPEYVVCPNCRHAHKPGWIEGGDKVLVLKPVYDFRRPDPRRNRHDTIVFKFPGWGERAIGDQIYEGPTYPHYNQAFSPYNYIKRLWGFPGERLAIWQGDVYLATDEENPRLTVIRKRPDRLLDMRQLVYDCDHEPQALAKHFSRWEDETVAPAPGLSQHQRPADGDRWQRQLLAGSTGLMAEFSVRAGAKPRWLRYQHRVPREWTAAGTDSPNNDGAWQRRIQVETTADQLSKNPPAPQLITDFLAYNWTNFGRYSWHWVRDLMIECEVEVARAEGTLALELVAGVDRYRAVWNLQTGECQLQAWREGLPLSLGENARTMTDLRRPGRYCLRFADFDQRLTVWVNERLVFGEGIAVPELRRDQHGPRIADLSPAAIMAQQTEVKVRHLRLWRDIYYTQRDPEDVRLSLVDTHGQVRDQVDIISLKDVPIEKYCDWAARIFRKLATEQPDSHRGALPPEQAALHRIRPERWAPYYPRGVVTHQVSTSGEVAFGSEGTYPDPAYYPDRLNGGSRVFGLDEYFVLGDNSTSSQDSRAWGQVPERLLMGKAVVVYFPFWPFGSSRLGLIR